MIKAKPPEQILTCKPEPDLQGYAEGASRQDYVGKLLVRYKFAWKDCWEKLKKVRQFVQD